MYPPPLTVPAQHTSPPLQSSGPSHVSVYAPGHPVAMGLHWGEAPMQHTSLGIVQSAPASPHAIVVAVGAVHGAVHEPKTRPASVGGGVAWQTGSQKSGAPECEAKQAS